MRICKLRNTKKKCTITGHSSFHAYTCSCRCMLAQPPLNSALGKLKMSPICLSASLTHHVQTVDVDDWKNSEGLYNFAQLE